MAHTPRLLGPVQFVGSFSGAMPEATVPEVAFAGRSNVGKSSAINALLGMRGLARVSRTPGRTQALNVFDVAGSWRVVDLPGYGHAKVSRGLRTQWKGWIEEYLFEREALRLVVALVDSRIPAQESDKMLLRALIEGQVPTLVLATKIDAISRTRRAGALVQLAAGLGVPRETLLPFSATEPIGIDDARGMLATALGIRPPK